MEPTGGGGYGIGDGDEADIKSRHQDPEPDVRRAGAAGKEWKSDGAAARLRALQGAARWPGGALCMTRSLICKLLAVPVMIENMKNTPLFSVVESCGYHTISPNIESL